MDLLNISVLVLTVCVNIGLFFLGKYYGSKEGYEKGLNDGGDDQNIMEVNLRNKINNLEETLKSIPIGTVIGSASYTAEKKRARAKK